jgi:predicted nucleic acid-binding protein
MSGAAAVGSPPGAGEDPLLDLVLDASVMIKWYIPENLAAEARRFLSPRYAMHVPSFFAAECGNTLWKKVAQRHELNPDRGREILRELLDYPKQVHATEELTALAYELAHLVGNAKLALYDFIYLALSVGLNCRLVTADRLFHDALRATPYAPHVLWVADPV